MDCKTAFALALAAVATAASPAIEARAEGAVLHSKAVGWAEEIRIGERGAVLDAKLDTGAETSSLHAEDLRIVRSRDQLRAEFTVIDRNGNRHRFDVPVVREATVRRAGTTPQRRPVVVLPLCLAGLSDRAEFTLADRGGLDYPVLIGRAFLAGRLIIDSSLTHSRDGTCGPR